MKMNEQQARAIAVSDEACSMLAAAPSALQDDNHE
jgi:hypothetical protein